MYPEAMKATFQIENPTYHSKVSFHQKSNLIAVPVSSYFDTCTVDKITLILNFFQGYFY